MSFLGGSQPTGTTVQKLTTLAVQTSSYGVCIGMAWGTTRITGNLIWYGDFQAIEESQDVGGKGGGSSVSGYSYKASWALGLVQSVVSSIPRVWADKNKTTLAEQGIELMSGAGSQAAWAYLASAHPSEALRYPYLAYVGAAHFGLGTGANMPNLGFEIVTDTAGVAGTPDAAPWQVLQDVLTAAGFPSSRLASLTEYTNFVGANGLFLSPHLSEQRRAADVVGDLLEMTHTAAFPSDGKLKLVPWGDTDTTGNGYTFTAAVAPVYALTDDDFLDLDGGLPIRVSRKAQADAKNKVRIEFKDRSSEYATGIATAVDDAHVAEFGERPADTITYDWIKTADTATRVAYLRLQRGLYTLNEYTFRLSWRHCLLEPMDIVTLSHPLMRLYTVPVRITGIEEDAEGALTITAEDFPQGAGHAPIVAPQPTSSWSTDMNVAPGNAATPVIFEPPIGLAGQPELWMATSGGSTFGGADVWVSLDNVTYQRVGTISGKSRHGVLTATLPSVSDPDTTSTLAVDLSLSGGELLGGTDTDRDLFNTLMWVGGELVSYRDATLTGVNRYNLASLRRGVYGSAISSHSAASKVVRCDDRLFRYAYDPALIGKTIYVKLQAWNIYGGAHQDLAGLTPTSYAVQGAPLGTVGGLQLESAFVGTEAAIKWSAYPGASSYTVEVWSAGVKRRTVTGLGSTRYTYGFQDGKADGGPFRALEFRVYAVAANGTSGSPAVITASNPQLGAPSGIATSGAGASIAITTNKPTATDYAGTKVWISATSGFSTASTAPAYDGPDTGYTALNLAAGTWYLQVAQYDVFGADGITTSGELAVTVTGATGVRNVTSLPANPAAVGGDLAVFLDTTTASQRGLWGWDGSAWKFTRDGANLVANSVTADKMAVTSLAAMSANLGTVTSGALILDAAGFVRGGQTYYNTGTGFWLGYSGGAYKFSLGNSSQGITWDGTNLSINGGGTFSGDLTAATVGAGGVTISSTGNIKGGQTSYDTGTGFWMGYSGGTYKFSMKGATGQGITFDGTDLLITGKFTAYAVSAVDTINIADNAVTIPLSAQWVGEFFDTPGATQVVATASADFKGQPVIITATILVGYTSFPDSSLVGAGVRIYRDGVNIATSEKAKVLGEKVSITYSIRDTPPSGSHTYGVGYSRLGGDSIFSASITVLGVKK